MKLLWWQTPGVGKHRHFLLGWWLILFPGALLDPMWPFLNPALLKGWLCGDSCFPYFSVSLEIKTLITGDWHPRAWPSDSDTLQHIEAVTSILTFNSHNKTHRLPTCWHQPAHRTRSQRLRESEGLTKNRQLANSRVRHKSRCLASASGSLLTMGPGLTLCPHNIPWTTKGLVKNHKEHRTEAGNVRKWREREKGKMWFESLDVIYIDNIMYRHTHMLTHIYKCNTS